MIIYRDTIRVRFNFRRLRWEARDRTYDDVVIRVGGLRKRGLYADLAADFGEQARSHLLAAEVWLCRRDLRAWERVKRNAREGVLASERAADAGHFARLAQGVA